MESLSRSGDRLDEPERLVARAAAGDQAVFATLVSRHTSEMARVAYIVCGDLEMANDAVQAAWQIAWQKLANLRNAHSLRAWLMAITANEARQIVRKERRRHTIESKLEAPIADSNDPADHAAIGALLASLDVDDRRLLALRFGVGLSSDEIGKLLGLSPSGTRVRLMRLLRRVRRELAE